MGFWDKPSRYRVEMTALQFEAVKAALVAAADPVANQIGRDLGMVESQAQHTHIDITDLHAPPSNWSY